MAHEAREVYAAWFAQLPWQWFATFTQPIGGSRDQLLRAHRRWSARLQTENGRQLRQALAIERQHNGTPHGHALIYGVRDDYDQFRAMRIWEEVAGGFARIYPYDPGRGAAAYCAKYVTKEGELQLLGPWPRYRPDVQLKLGLTSSTDSSTASG